MIEAKSTFWYLTFLMNPEILRRLLNHRPIKSKVPTLLMIIWHGAE